MEGVSRKWLPHAQPAQKKKARRESRYASSERKQHGFGEQLAQNAIAARTKSQAQGHFARTVGGPRRKHEDQAAPAYKGHYFHLWDSFFSDTNPRSSDRQWPAPE